MKGQPSYGSLSSQVIDALRFPCAVFVVLIHAWWVEPQSGPAAYSFPELFQIFFAQGICRIAVPLFFFISGYLFFTKLERWDWKVYFGKLKKRTKTLLVPYLLWISLAILWELSFSLFRHYFFGWGDPFQFLADKGWGLMYWNCARNFHFVSETNLLGWAMPFAYPFDYPLWFIRDLISLCLFAPAIHYAIRKTKGWILALLYPLYLLNFWIPLEGFSAEGAFFFSLGACLQLSGKDILAVFERFKLPALFVFIPTLIVGFQAYGNDPRWGYLIKLMTLPGCIVVFNLVAYLVKKSIWRCNRFLSEVSFPLYASHTIGLTLLTGFLLEKLLPIDAQWAMFIRIILKPIIIIAIILVLYRLASKYIPRTTALFTGNRSKGN